MSTHKINFDAIRAGARALLRSYPDTPVPPTSVPPRVHRVLWMDDWWRGADMMSEACRRAFQAEVNEVGSRAAGPMTIVEMHRRHQAVCAAVGGGLLPDERLLVAVVGDRLHRALRASRHGRPRGRRRRSGGGVNLADQSGGERAAILARIHRLIERQGRRGYSTARALLIQALDAQYEALRVGTSRST